MNIGNDAMGHVLVDIVTDRIDATNLMNVEGYGTPHPGHQSHLSIGAAFAQHDEATLPSNGVKGMFGVFCMFLPYFICSIIIITSQVVYMCSGKEKKRGRSTEQIVPIIDWQTASGHSKREDKASVSYNRCKVCN